MPEDPRPTVALLTEYAVLAEELRRRGVLGADASEQGLRRGYAKRLVASALDGRVEVNPAKAYDVVLDDGDRVQVAAVDPGDLRAGPLRSWGFDALAVVCLDDGLRVVEALLLPRSVAQVLAVREAAGPYVPRSADVLSAHEFRDVTDLLRAASRAA